MHARRTPTLGELRLGLLGRHQAANAAVALGIARGAAGRGHRRCRSSAPSGAGLAATRWPGRLELLTLGPMVAPRPAAGRARTVDVLLDGAHNAAGAAALAAALDELRAAPVPGAA